MESLNPEEEEVLIMDNSQIIKRRLKNLIYSDKYCGLCYEESKELHSFDTELEIFGDFGFHEVTLYDVFELIFKKEANKVLRNIHTQKICSSCLEQLNKCYLFIGNMEYNYKVMNNYMDQLHSKVLEVDSIGNQESIVIVLNHCEDMNIYHTETKLTIEAKSSFKCSRCNIEKSSYEDLKIHEKTHKWKAKVNCKICDELVYKQAYREHLKVKHCLFTNNDSKPQQKLGIHPIGPGVNSLPKFSVLTQKNLNTLPKLSVRQDLQANPEDRLGFAKVFIPVNNLNEQNTCKLCFKKLDKASLRVHKCQYSCTECDFYDCIHLKYLIAFREQAHSNKKLKCPETDCDYGCTNRKQLIGHLNKVHLDHHPFTCDMCQQQFYSKMTLQKHIANYHSPTFYCDYCDQDFSKNPKNFNDHISSCKETFREHPCAKCVASFDTLEALTKHNARGCRNLPCLQCNLKFTEESKLSEHKSKVHCGVQILGVSLKHEPEVLTCEICGAECVSKSKLKMHVKACHTEVTCPECGKKCSKGSFRYHVATHFYTQENLTCKVCGELFKNIYALQRHKQWHTEKVPCPVCLHQVHKGRLARHIKYHNMKKRYYSKIKCSKCEYRTTNINTLEAHINLVHFKIRPYTCNVCHNSYCGKYELTKHMEAHTRPKERICEVCNVKLLNKASYQRHMARSHTGDLPFKCDSCDKSYFRACELTRHKETKHLITRTVYKCPVFGCKRVLKYKRSLRAHVKKLHWINKGKPFDPKDVKGLDRKYYHLLEDSRRRSIY